MVYNLSKDNPLVGGFIAELRDVNIQQDRMRFRRNVERIGEILAYEISKRMAAKSIEVITPLGVAQCDVLKDQPIIGTILRAGLPLHQGMLNYFDKADSAFVSAYRKHHKSGEFTIKVEYLSCPSLEDRILIVCDPMLATGASMSLTLERLYAEGTPKEVHVVCVLACEVGIAEVRRHFPNVTIWVGALDDELTAKGYIVPGLGDAGDLAYGEKMQD